MPVRTPGQWPDSSQASDVESVESKDVEDDSDETPYLEPDLALISELLENIERNPLAPEARLLLMQQYAMCGWYDAAKEQARRVLEIDPTAKEAQEYLDDPRKLSLRGADEAGSGKANAKPARSDIKFKEDHGEAANFGRLGPQSPTWRPSLFPILSPVESLRELEDGYIALLESANLCLTKARLLKILKAPDYEEQISDLEALKNGQISSTLRLKPLGGVQVVAEAIVADSTDGCQNGLNAAVKDLKDLTKWLRKSECSAESSSKGKSRSNGKDDQDQLREALLKRVKALKALLPKDLQPLADLAMMHAEHEVLHRTYVNDKTMTFDAVSDIPRAHFWSSEDGYAWDMEELGSAITSGKGVMRNPLSKRMFTRADIRAIIQHPLGNGLQALHVEQLKRKRGVRPQTIDELDKLAKVLIVDKSEDGKPSHLAIEAFVSYLETLPRSEQKAIDELKVPAKDSHTGMEFDTTIGEAVKDVQGNRVCSHKTGDFLAQAVKYLK